MAYLRITSEFRNLLATSSLTYSLATPTLRYDHRTIISAGYTFIFCFLSTSLVGPAKFSEIPHPAHTLQKVIVR